jgi:hypothetical protein
MFNPTFWPAYVNRFLDAEKNEKLAANLILLEAWVSDLLTKGDFLSGSEFMMLDV